jgi:hypothetical protein
MIQTVRLAEVLGLRHEVADEIARYFVLGAQKRLPVGGFADVQIIAACMHSRRPTSLDCIARIRDSMAGAKVWSDGMAGAADFIKGAESFARGDMKGAVRWWRPYAQTSFYASQLPAEAFDAAGESEIASLLDANRLASGRGYAGVDPAHVREAKRAAARGDRARGRQLAQMVSKAWASSDTELPAVKEMRTLLVRLGS